MIKQLDWSEWKLDEFSYTLIYKFIQPNHYPIEKELRHIFLPQETSNKEDAKEYVSCRWIETIQSIL